MPKALMYALFSLISQIVCTEPRRISAISLASRVTDEMCSSSLGLVGYQVRGEKTVTRNTRLCYMTTGILLRRLQGDDLLAGITHVVVVSWCEPKV